MLGHESTVPVTLDEMIFLTRAVTRAAPPAARDRRPAVRLVRDLRRAGGRERDPDAQGGRRRLRQARGRRAGWSSRARAIAESNIGVMGHIGLTPQSATKLGGFRAQGRTADAALALYDDALALQDAGCFAIVLEAVPAPVAARITRGARRSRRSASAPAPAATARCSSGTTCSGCTTGPRRGSSSGTRRIADEIGEALGAYVADVRGGRVPGGAAHLLDPRGRARGSSRRRSQSAARGRAAPRRERPARPPRRAARAHVQPWTARDADHEQAGRPGEEARAEQPRRPCRRCPASAPPRWKSALAPERELRPARGRARARPGRPRTRARGARAGTSPASRARRRRRGGAPPSTK